MIDFPMDFGPKKRKLTTAVQVGQVLMGGNQPVVVQSMTNTDTADIQASVDQVWSLSDAGSELVRLTVNTESAAQAIPQIKEKLLKLGCDTPLIGDFHYNGHRLLSQHPECITALDKLRINPGNVGFGKNRDRQFLNIIELAITHQKTVRIGVNWGSLDQTLLARLMDENAQKSQPWPSRALLREALVISALENAKAAEQHGLSSERIVLSCKVSEVQDLIAVYRSLAKRSDYALHLGLTEAGMGSKGIVASTAALSVLLQEGIGDTIRISLTPEPGQSRTREVIVAQELLQTMGLRAFTPLVTACPGCGRTSSSYFQELAQDIQQFVRDKMPEWKQKYPGVETLSLAVMGCVVNGPGESKYADIGISLPGTGEEPSAPVFIDGKKVATLKGEHIAKAFQTMLVDYVENRFG